MAIKRFTVEMEYWVNSDAGCDYMTEDDVQKLLVSYIRRLMKKQEVFDCNYIYVKEVDSFE